jgi:HAD superfamily phosphoserine phosphatase-like hydrolase
MAARSFLILVFPYLEPISHEVNYNGVMEKTIVGFDLNKTLIKENSWYDLNLAMGISSQEDELLYRLGPEGEGILTFEEWIDILTRLMRTRGKASHQRIEEAILNFNYLDGAKETVSELKSQGFIVGVISGALSPIVGKVSRDLKMDFKYCNAEMLFDDKNMLQSIDLHNTDFKFKVDAVTDLRRKYSGAKEIYYVADGDTDEEIFKVAKGILVDTDRALHEECKKEALEDGDEFSAHRSAKYAWKIVASLGQVADLLKNN